LAWQSASALVTAGWAWRVAFGNRFNLSSPKTVPTLASAVCNCDCAPATMFCTIRISPSSVATLVVATFETSASASFASVAFSPVALILRL